MDNSSLQRLLDAHVAFVVANLQGERLQREIELEVEAVFERMQTLTLSEVMPQPVLLDIVKTRLLRSHLSMGAAAELVRMSMLAVATAAASPVKLSDVVSRSRYDEMVDALVKYGEVREKIIHEAMASPLYSGLVSDVLYYGIKDYLLSDNSLAMKIPGMGSLMKMGKWGLDKTVPNLEQTAEKAIKNYIESNIHRTLHISEKFLNNSLGADNIRKVSDHVWALLNKGSLDSIAKHVNQSEIEDVVTFAANWWLELRDNPQIHQWLEEGIGNLYRMAGERELGPWLQQMGVTRDGVISELGDVLPRVLGRPAVSDYIAERVGVQLRAFYESAEAKSALAG